MAERTPDRVAALIQQRLAAPVPVPDWRHHQAYCALPARAEERLHNKASMGNASVFSWRLHLRGMCPRALSPLAARRNALLASTRTISLHDAYPVLEATEHRKNALHDGRLGLALGS